MIVGYLDISENNVSRQEQQILLQDYACSTRCRIDVFHCDSDIRNLYQKLGVAHRQDAVQHAQKLLKMMGYGV